MSKTPAVSTNANTVAKHISNTENFVNAAKALLCPLRLFLIIPPLKSNFPIASKIFYSAHAHVMRPRVLGSLSPPRGSPPLRLSFVRLAARSW